MTRVLLTGAAGFVGSHVLARILKHTDWSVVCPVTFRHQGRPSRLSLVLAEAEGESHRARVVLCDLGAPLDDETVGSFGRIDAILNVASDSHVDRSITHPAPFVRNNVDVMLNVLEYARRATPRVVLQMSTDEVYGPATGDHAHVEWDPIRPSNPYSASKAAQEAIAHAYWRTFDVPLVVTNTMNLIGPRQDAEKFVPMCLDRIVTGRRVDIHADPHGRAGSRFYLHAANLADAWVFLTRRYLDVGPPVYSQGAAEPDRFHIVGEREIDNLSLYRTLYDSVRREINPAFGPVPDPCYQVTSFHASRPGHDLRYALDGSKLGALGWTPPVPLDESLRDTVRSWLGERGILR